eukprot:CAMPEP_0173419740 /NCGR_PEP_ID=MMETSP1357-20121228/1468_1 /TAXON_ID=77926 /ORGANISM="Hemiselmis rufescens, Strain PCC563" /LENGTH=210 /DNA_ID=CAMNT_0014382425 /DNA_START=17 /DNA_END=645 /DNA_ORIENTATION=-
MLRSVTIILALGLASASAPSQDQHSTKAARAQHALHRAFRGGAGDGAPTSQLDVYNQDADENYATSTSGADPRCPIGSIVHKMPGFEDICAWRASPATSWGRGEALCQQEGGHMASFKNKEELFFLQSLLSFTKQFWVGYKKMDGSSWYFTDGTNPSYAKSLWAPGQPDNHNNNEACAEMVSWAGTGQTDRVNDRNCNDKLPYMCVKNVG